METKKITDAFVEFVKVIEADYDEFNFGEFSIKVNLEFGRKYAKVITGNGMWASVHSFIVLADDGKFKAGDILKAASDKAPARNKARGNVLGGDLSRVRWTGVI